MDRTIIFSSLIRTLRLWLVMICEQLLIFPITFIIISLAEIQSVPRFFIYFLTIALLVMLSREFLPKKFRPWIIIVGILLGIAICMVSTPNLFFRIFTPIYIAAFLWHGINMVEMGNHGLFFTSFMLLGFIFYPIVTWVLQHSPRFQSLLPILSVTGTVGILLSLILINRQQVRDAGTILERKIHLPRSLLKNNSMFAAVFVLLALIATAWEAFGTFAAFLFSLFSRAITGIFQFLSSLFPTSSEEAPPPAATDQSSGMLPEGNPSPKWMDVLQTIVIVIAVVASVLFVIWGLYRLIKKIIPLVKPFFQKIYSWIQQFFIGYKSLAGADLGFVDEVESLLNQNESSFSAARKWLSKRIDIEPGFSAMKTDKEKIRWLYRNRLRKEIRKGFDYQPGETPLEALQKLKNDKYAPRKDMQPELSAAIYSKARYSDELISQENVQVMKKALHS